MTRYRSGFHHRGPTPAVPGLVGFPVALVMLLGPETLAWTLVHADGRDLRE